MNPIQKADAEQHASSGGGIPQKRRRHRSVVILATTMVLGAIGLILTAFYILNDGWKTPAQREADFRHRFLPLDLARHGDMRALDAENRLRRAQGQPPLSLPPDSEIGSDREHVHFLQLQRDIAARRGWKTPR